MTIYQGLQYNDTSSSTLAGIKQDIYFLGHCSSASISDGDLNRIINKYYFQTQEVVRQVNENFYMVEASTDLLSPTQGPNYGRYTYPDGNGTAPAYEKIKSLWVAINPADPTNPQDNEYERVLCVDPDEISDPSYVFTRPTALMFGNYFTMAALGNNTITYPITNGIKTYYIAENAELINDTDRPILFPSFHDAIVQGSLIDVAERLGKEQLKQDSVALFKKRLSDIQSYASDRLPDEIGLVEGQSEQGGWEFPFGKGTTQFAGY